MNEGTVFIPVRPLVARLVVAWSPQLRRINRDPLLSEEILGVDVTTTLGRKQKMMWLSLGYTSGFLSGVNANRMKVKARVDRLTRLETRCFISATQIHIEAAVLD